MRQVSADIAHDLRTPLNRLRIRIETASTKAEAGQSVADDLATALTEADQINQTFAALLRIAQIESGSRKAGFQSLQPGILLGDVIDIYRGVAEDSGQTLTMGPKVEARINGDPELLTQAFVNLIENAIRHCPAGTLITCGVSTIGAKIVVSVADNGPGIVADQRLLALQRLYRLEQSRTTPGSGLGLSLVKAVADLHGADLGLEDCAPGLRVSLTFDKIEN